VQCELGEGERDVVLESGGEVGVGLSGALEAGCEAELREAAANRGAER
jgi:hypothetical protein